MKTCTRCKLEKPLEDFHNKKKRDGTPGKCSRCRTCECELKKIRYSPEKKRKYDLKKTFGITPEHYNEMLKEQNNCCAICGTSDFSYSRGKKPHIDHCHSTGRVRGLLCGNCNLGVGQFFDEIWRLEKAIEYLKQHQPLPE